MKKQIRNFINNELSSMGDNIITSSSENLDNRKYNLFHCFSDDEKDIVKYMALGRSFDSQLGNRLQRIAMYVARLTFGVENVPNYLFLNANKAEKKITIWKFSFPDELDIRHKSIGFNVYKTQCYYKSKSKKSCLEYIMKTSEDTLKAIIKDEKKIDSFRNNVNKRILKDEMEKYKALFENLIQEVTYECDDEKILTHIENISKDIPVDLLYFKNVNSIFVYEIKAGGDLDSKNCESNADEVLDNLKCFSFINDNNSYFATCYNNRGEDGDDTYSNKDGVIYFGQRPVGGIFNIYDKIDRKTGKTKWADMRNRILVGRKFWEQVLPVSISFDKFMEIYKLEFEKSDLEKKLKEIDHE